MCVKGACQRGEGTRDDGGVIDARVGGGDSGLDASAVDASLVDAGPEATLLSLRGELGCVGGVCNNVGCVTGGGGQSSDVFATNRNQLWDVTVRVRGVVELAPYTGGVADGYWYAGGTGAQGNNVARLQVSDPPQSYYLNSGSAQQVVGVDYQRTVSMTSGAQVTLVFEDSDSCSLPNSPNLTIPNIPPAPNVFNGQFVQLDFVDAVLSP